MKKFILFLNYEFFPLGGGGSTVCYYVAKNLVKKGFRVELITSHYRGLKKEEEIDGIKIHRIPTLRKRKDFCSVPEMAVFILSSCFYLLNFCRKNRPDLIQVFFTLPSAPAAYLVKKIYQIPYVVYSGGADMPGGDPRRFGWVYPLVTPLVKKIWQASEKLIVASDGLKELALRVDPSVKVKRITNGVDLTRFKPSSQSKREKIRVLGVGRLIPRKGFHFLIQALPKVVSQTKQPFEVEIIGSGQEEKNLKKLAQELKVEKFVLFSGSVSYDDLLKKYQAADIFVLPSLSEGMPCVMLEAMGCGLPVIASDIPGNDELVFSGQNGYLFSVGDSDKLAEYLAKVISNQSLREKMAQASLKIIQNYDWSKITDEYIKIYQRVI